MNPIARIKKLLDERGVEHVDGTFHEGDEDRATSWRNGEVECTAVLNDDGTLSLWIDNSTPERAVMATLGSEGCPMAMSGLMRCEAACEGGGA